MHSQNLLVSGLLVQLIDAHKAIHVPWLGSSALPRRDSTPTASCPEQFGNPSINCDSLSRSTIDNDPPFKPLPKESADCPIKSDDDVSSVTRTFWKGVSKKFCDDIGDGKSAKKADLRNTDIQMRSIFQRTPPPSPSAFPDWKFHFEWEPQGSGVCVKNCDQAMDALTAACSNDGQERNGMIKHGTLDVGCGKYSYSLEGPPKPPVADPFCWTFNNLGYPIYLVANKIGWVSDEGAAFKKFVENDCVGHDRDLTPPRAWLSYDSPPYRFFKFSLSSTDNSCIERAIKASGGPEISCSDHRFDPNLYSSQSGSH